MLLKIRDKTDRQTDEIQARLYKVIYMKYLSYKQLNLRGKLKQDGGFEEWN